MACIKPPPSEVTPPSVFRAPEIDAPAAHAIAGTKDPVTAADELLAEVEKARRAAGPAATAPVLRRARAILGRARRRGRWSDGLAVLERLVDVHAETSGRRPTGAGKTDPTSQRLTLAAASVVAGVASAATGTGVGSDAAARLAARAPDPTQRAAAAVVAQMGDALDGRRELTRRAEEATEATEADGTTTTSAGKPPPQPPPRPYWVDAPGWDGSNYTGGNRRTNAAAASDSPQARATGSTLDEILDSRAIPLDVPELLRIAMNNEKIPASLRAELPSAMAKVQEISPRAPGISVETVGGVEIGRASRGHSGTVWTSTVAGRGHAHGYAYEIIAASRFIDTARVPGTGGRPLHIMTGDDLIFGQKLPAGSGRRTVEADVLVVKPGGHKIAIDAKNYSRAFPASRDLSEQLDGIKEAVRQGEVHEFHFAVRGAMSPAAKFTIERADLELRAEMRNAVESPDPTISELQARGVDLSHAVIGWHENLG